MNETNEVRLIDANKIKPVHIEYCGKVVDWSSIEYAHTIDPETLPIVQQLRQELKNEIAEIEICGETIERLDKQLKKITAERDAAVSDLRVRAIESYDECMYCLYRTAKSFCWNCNDGSNWTWRGPQKEE